MAEPLSPDEKERIRWYWEAESASEQKSLASSIADLTEWLLRKGFVKVVQQLSNTTLDRILLAIGLKVRR